MSLLRISDVAERAGVPSTTLRYYERIGLVAPVGRSENGYRAYDETTLERLAFIRRAKHLGMSLDDVATLLEVWFSGDCGPVQERLRAFVAGRIAELRGQIQGDIAFARELERILARLGDGRTAPERCGPDCGCDTDPLDTADPDVGRPSLRCSLVEADAERRLEEWRGVVSMARSTERSVGELRAVFDASADVVAELARLCAAETACCPFFTFALGIHAGSVVVQIGGPPEAQDAIGAFFDLIAPPGPPAMDITTGAARANPSRRQQAPSMARVGG